MLNKSAIKIFNTIKLCCSRLWSGLRKENHCYKVPFMQSSEWQKFQAVSVWKKKRKHFRQLHCRVMKMSSGEEWKYQSENSPGIVRKSARNHLTRLMGKLTINENGTCDGGENKFVTGFFSLNSKCCMQSFHEENNQSKWNFSLRFSRKEWKIFYEQCFFSLW